MEAKDTPISPIMPEAEEDPHAIVSLYAFVRMWLPYATASFDLSQSDQLNVENL
jgi:hypothetical protein